MELLWRIAVALGAERYEPRGDASLLNDRVLLLFYVSSGMLALVSCICIGVVLYVQRGRSSFFLDHMRAHMAFIFFIGALFFLSDVLTLYVAIYRLDVFIRAAAAATLASIAFFLVADLIKEGD